VKISKVAFLVRNYDEAIEWFTKALGYSVVEDTRLSVDKRWVVIAPPCERGTALLLAKAVGPEQEARIGDQAGGRVFLFLETDDFERDAARMRAAGVRFLEPPRTETYGKVAVFEDLYGGKWDLIQPA